jgi:hypothetical protein
VEKQPAAVATGCFFLRKLILLLIISLIAQHRSVPAAAQSGEEDSTDAAWRAERNWTIAIPLWLPGYRGEFAIGSITVDGESSGGSGEGFLGRLFDNEIKLNFFFTGSVAYEHDRWRFYADAFGGNFTDDVIFKLTDGTIVSATVQPAIIDGHVEYNVFNHWWDDTRNQRIQIYVYGGVRYYDVRVNVDSVQRSRKVHTNWADPIVGTWIPVDFSRRWSMQLSGDIGGFNLGSNLSWSIFGLVVFKASPLVSFRLGYNILDVDYQDTIASLDFVYRVRVGGPVAGIGFNF